MSGRVHTCHARACGKPCPPRLLFCRTCWDVVTPDTKREVNRTVGLRGPDVDRTWAGWWRAQARAVAENAVVREVWTTEQARDWIARADAFATKLEGRGTT